MILIVGSGVAGMSSALAAVAAGADVELVTPGTLRGACGADALAGGNTALAQGGIAAVVGSSDSPAAHAADTVAAGVGLVDPEAAELLTAEGSRAVRGLLARGFAADRDAAGAVALGLEAAHGVPRIVHAGGDRTGAVLHAFLAAEVRAAVDAGRLRLLEHTALVSLLTNAGAVTGAVLRTEQGLLSAARADAVILATGGYAALYPRTSNHEGARGEGIALAARAGALVADLEFVQFHPTVLAGTGQLISEAVRGAGAVLRDGSGERFMRPVHEAAELAPRDVVSRTIHRVLRDRGEDAVWLDATGIERAGGPGTLARHFPGITRAVAALGLDWAHDPIPVAPAAHYTMGGVATDLDGRSSVPALFAAGETAATGVHGANRLASNSLLEGLVFGANAGSAAAAHVARAPHDRTWEYRGRALPLLVDSARDLSASVPTPQSGLEGAADSARAEHVIGAEVRHEGGPRIAPQTSGDVAAPESEDRVAAAVESAVARGLGIERDEHGIRAVAKTCAAFPGLPAELACMIAEAALARTESRGAHQRADHPDTDPALAVRQAWVRSATPPLTAHTTAHTPANRSLAAC